MDRTFDVFDPDGTQLGHVDAPWIAGNDDRETWPVRLEAGGEREYQTALTAFLGTKRRVLLVPHEEVGDVAGFTPLAAVTAGRYTEFSSQPYRSTERMAATYVSSSEPMLFGSHRT